jgi:hypothetical protein
MFIWLERNRTKESPKKTKGKKNRPDEKNKNKKEKRTHQGGGTGGFWGQIRR